MDDFLAKPVRAGRAGSPRWRAPRSTRAVLDPAGCATRSAATSASHRSWSCSSPRPRRTSRRSPRDRRERRRRVERAAHTLKGSAATVGATASRAPPPSSSAATRAVGRSPSRSVRTQRSKRVTPCLRRMGSDPGTFSGMSVIAPYLARSRHPPRAGGQDRRRRAARWPVGRDRRDRGWLVAGAIAGTAFVLLVVATLGVAAVVVWRGGSGTWSGSASRRLGGRAARARGRAGERRRLGRDRHVARRDRRRAPRRCLDALDCRCSPIRSSRSRSSCSPARTCSTRGASHGCGWPR